MNTVEYRPEKFLNRDTIAEINEVIRQPMQVYLIHYGNGDGGYGMSKIKVWITERLRENAGTEAFQYISNGVRSVFRLTAHHGLSFVPDCLLFDSRDYGMEPGSFTRWYKYESGPGDSPVLVNIEPLVCKRVDILRETILHELCHALLGKQWPDESEEHVIEAATLACLEGEDEKFSEVLEAFKTT